MLFRFLCSIIFVAAECKRAVNLSGSYDLLQTVLIHDSSNDAVGFQVSAKLEVFKKGAQVFMGQLVEPKLRIMSRKAPSGGFVQHSSALDKLLNQPFFIEWEDGKVLAVHLRQNEEISTRNLQRSLASLFMIGSKDGLETDSSGTCSVSYQISDNIIHRVKSNCNSGNFTHSQGVWGGEIKSDISCTTRLTDDGNIEQIVSEEKHEINMNIADMIKGVFTADITLTRTGNTDGGLQYEGENNEVVDQIIVEVGGLYTRTDLTLEKEQDTCGDKPCPKLADIIKESMETLREYGTAKSASGIYKLVKAFRQAGEDEIIKALKSKEFKSIRRALIDIAGIVQTEASHQAVLRRIKINTDKYKLDDCERYLWALSMSPRPSLNITKDVIQLIKKKHKDEKLYQTLLLTGTAMAYRISVKEDDPNHEVVNDLFSDLEEKLKACDEDDGCREFYLKALIHLRNPITKPTFIKYAINHTKKSGVTAMRGIYKLGRSHWGQEELQLARRVLLSSGQFDSSSRLVALQILLDSGPSEDILQDIFSLLHLKDREINELILQKTENLIARCPKFREMVSKVGRDVKHWSAQAQGGLSTSFSRNFMDTGYLSTDQEIVRGLLKRGQVHINLKHNNSLETLFTLGLFSSGLGSFVSSGDDSEEVENENASAGMELEVMGVELRPFVFFDGQGELISHVWSGTASEETTAFESLVMLGLTEGEVAVAGAGCWAQISLSAAASPRLSGLIQISMWNKNAHSQVFNRAGLSVGLNLALENSFVKTSEEGSLLAEPSVILTADVDTGSSISLCLKLEQPTTTIKYNSFKEERIPGSKHKLRKSRFMTMTIPGKTYSLNKKNNDMCNAINQS